MLTFRDLKIFLDLCRSLSSWVCYNKFMFAQYDEKESSFPAFNSNAPRRADDRVAYNFCRVVSGDHSTLSWRCCCCGGGGGGIC